MVNKGLFYDEILYQTPGYPEMRIFERVRCGFMKRKSFLHYPEYPGGKDELKRYISENLVYPEAAILGKISGTVWLSAEINGNGQVTEVVVERGLGHGCDEEAVRLVSGLHYGGVTNRGIRLRIRHRFRIHFDLNGYLRRKETEKFPESGKSVVYSFKPSVQKEKLPEKSVKPGGAAANENSGKIPGEKKQNDSQRYVYSITLSHAPEPDGE